MTFRKVSVLVPTRGRVARLAAMRASFYATAGSDEAELVFRADADDRETAGYLLEAGERRYRVGPRLDGYRSLPAFFNEMAGMASGDVLMLGNDDMVFRTPGWASRVLAACNRFPDGVFNVGVATHNADHYPFSVVSRAVVARLGFLWDPRVYWGDVWLRDVMAAFGRCVMLDDVRVDHEWAGHAPDATFVEADQDSIYQRVPDYWTTVHGPMVEEAVARLRGMVQPTEERA